jgi:hypothetical protein
MGWMTLHSISVCYPENPSNFDKETLKRFMNLFADCITCPSCKNHFTSMFSTYQRMHPEWANSRFDLFVAICRMHNTVNKRLDKPRIATVREALATLVSATTVTSAPVFRASYIQYLLNNWMRQGDGDGRIYANVARQMMKINNEYWSLREVQYISLIFPETDLLEFVPENPNMYNIGNGVRPFVPSTLGNVGFTLKGGRLSLSRK